MNDLKNSGFPYPKTVVFPRVFLELNLVLNLEKITIHEISEQFPLHHV